MRQDTFDNRLLPSRLTIIKAFILLAMKKSYPSFILGRLLTYLISADSHDILYKFLLFKLIYPLPTMHILAETIKLCVAEFSIFEPQLSDNRIIYLVRLSSARMTHAAVFVLLPVLSVRNLANISPSSPASFFITSSRLSPARTVLKL